MLATPPFPPTIGALLDDTLEQTQRAERKRQLATAPAAATAAKSRHVTWTPGVQYECVRKGTRVLTSEGELDELFSKRSSDIHERLFFIFRNRDPSVERNANVPLYEACYACADGRYLKVQKCHLKLAYTHAERTDAARAWDVDEHGVPYWVDRYAMCKMKLRVNKQRYEKKQKTGV